MIPVAPRLFVRPIQKEDCAPLATLIGILTNRTAYTRRIDQELLLREVLSDSPPTVRLVRWQSFLHLGAWRAGQLVGFLDLAVGHDSESLELPEYHPLGLIRFLALPDRKELIPDVAEALFAEAQQFWQQSAVGYVKAFHVSTGYPWLQAGAGVLPGDWPEHVRVLTGMGFRFVTRYYTLSRRLESPVEESVPLADISLVQRGPAGDRTYHVYFRRTEWIGSAHVVSGLAETGDRHFQYACLANIEIAPRWRRQDIGKWLLRRVINDATLQGFPELVVFVAHEQNTAMNLFVQHGFQELNYRGYTLDKSLSQ